MKPTVLYLETECWDTAVDSSNILKHWNIPYQCRFWVLNRSQSMHPSMVTYWDTREEINPSCICGHLSGSAFSYVQCLMLPSWEIAGNQCSPAFRGCSSNFFAAMPSTDPTSAIKSETVMNDTHVMACCREAGQSAAKALKETSSNLGRGMDHAV